MLIFDLLGLVVVLGTLGGGGLFLWRDSKGNFAVTKALAGKAMQKVGKFVGRGDGEIEIADKAINCYAKNLGMLRDAVATIEANYKQAGRQAQEQIKIADDFQEVEEDALKKGDQETAEVAAIAKIQALKRVEIYEDSAQTQIKVAEVLSRELEETEMEFDVVQTKAETIRVYHSMAQAKRQLYNMISNVEKSIGLTSQGQLNQLLLKTEHENIKADSLLEMAKKRNSNKARGLIEATDVRKDIEEVSKKLGLLAAAPSEVEDK